MKKICFALLMFILVIFTSCSGNKANIKVYSVSTGGNSTTLNIDAEEADRLELSLDVLEPVFAHPDLAGWNGFGLAGTWPGLGLAA